MGMKGRESVAWHYTSDRDFRLKRMGTKSPRKFTILVPFLLNSPTLGTSWPRASLPSQEDYLLADAPKAKSVSL
jgi:hypothetical protein